MYLSLSATRIPVFLIAVIVLSAPSLYSFLGTVLAIRDHLAERTIGLVHKLDYVKKDYASGSRS